ncbi:Redox-sensing transcriptional repressor Rex [subsurface metagenome]
MAVNKIIKRLLEYRQCLMQLQLLGFKKVFSYTLGDKAGVTAEQVRKDFSLYGMRGNKKGGYVINELLVTINEIFQKSEVQNVIIAGMGNIGKALSQYKNFKKNNINIVAAFDIDPAKHTKKFGISVYPLNKLTSLIKEYNVNIAIIAVPDIAAQEICNILVINGIKGIMNFSPVVLQVPEDVIVNNINLGNELEGLIYEATFKAK